MRNRAKCKLCNDIIESLSVGQQVVCKCGHISVGGIHELSCLAYDWNNFLRIDDEGNEIIVKVQERTSKPDKKELLNLLDEMIKNIEQLPPQAMSTSINHYDFCSALILLSSILRAE